jgi:biopolymer transport protein ExbD
MQIKHDDVQEHEFQIAPMVDVVFMLIIFFMLSAFARTEDRELPFSLSHPPGPPDTIPPPPIELTIQGNGTVFFNDLEVGKPDDVRLAELQARLQRALQLSGDKQPVIIAPAATAPHERVVEVVDCCATARVQALSFAQ